MVSQSAEYALRAVLHLAQHAGRGPLHAAAVANALDMPRNYLGKILHGLAKAGVLASVRGPSGGFTLAVPESELTLQRIIAPFDEVPRRRSCLLGNAECGDENPCTAHEHWKGVAEPVVAFFRTTTVAQLLSAVAPVAPPGPPPGATGAQRSGPGPVADPPCAGRPARRVVVESSTAGRASSAGMRSDTSTDGGHHV